MLYPPAQFLLYVSGCLFFQNVTLLFQLWFKSLLLTRFYLYSLILQHTSLSRSTMCRHITLSVCGFRGRRGASEAALQSGWGVLLRVSPQQSWEIHRLHHLGRSAHPKEVSLYAACFTALPQHITSSDLNDWVSWGLRRPHVQDLVFFLSPFCEADCFSFFFLPSFLVWILVMV